MNLPLISIVVPVYNVEAYIEHCIHNILSQTYRNLEVIIVNDGSPDDSIKIAKELKVTMIIVTHEIGFAKEVADQVVFMEGGVIVEQGDPKVVLEHPKEERTRKFLSRYLTLDSELPLDSAAL